MLARNIDLKLNNIGQNELSLVKCVFYCLKAHLQDVFSSYHPQPFYKYTRKKCLRSLRAREDFTALDALKL